MSEVAPITALVHMPMVTEEKRVTYYKSEAHIDGKVKVEAVTDEWLIYDYRGMVKTSHRASTIDYLA